MSGDSVGKWEFHDKGREIYGKSEKERGGAMIQEKALGLGGIFVSFDSGRDGDILFALCFRKCNKRERESKISE